MQPKPKKTKTQTTATPLSSASKPIATDAAAGAPPKAQIPAGEDPLQSVLRAMQRSTYPAALQWPAAEDARIARINAAKAACLDSTAAAAATTNHGETLLHAASAQFVYDDAVCKALLHDIDYLHTEMNVLRMEIDAMSQHQVAASSTKSVTAASVAHNDTADDDDDDDNEEAGDDEAAISVVTDDNTAARMQSQKQVLVRLWLRYRRLRSELVQVLSTFTPAAMQLKMQRFLKRIRKLATAAAPP